MVTEPSGDACLVLVAVIFGCVTAPLAVESGDSLTHKPTLHLACYSLFTGTLR